MNLFAYVGVNLGVLSLLAITPIQKPTLNTETYKTHLFMLDMGNWEREMKERSWAEKQPCTTYEPQAMEETANCVLTEGNEVDASVNERPVRQNNARTTSVETNQESDATADAVVPAETPIYQVDGYVPDVNLQEYLYNRLAEHGIEWFMPYAVCLIAQESSWNPLVENVNGLDKGLLQYRIGLVPWMDWRNPYQEIDYFVSQMANRANNLGCTVSDMISRHNVSDFCPYNQAYVDAVMSHSGSLVRVR